VGVDIDKARCNDVPDRIDHVLSTFCDTRTDGGNLSLVNRHLAGKSWRARTINDPTVFDYEIEHTPLLIGDLSATLAQAQFAMKGFCLHCPSICFLTACAVSS
jgi:hypothetical protein